MANNPYHDETGKFCSKNDMQGAIARLAKAGDFEGYFKLRTELENIESQKVTLSKEFVTSLTTSGLSIFGRNKDEPATAEDIREIYNLIDFNDENTIPSSYTLLSLVESPTTPQDIKDDILANAPVEVKQEILNSGAMESSPLLASDLKKAMIGETDDELMRQIIYTEKLTFEDKYNIVKQSERGLAMLATSQPKTFFSVPELEEELADKAVELLKNKSEAGVFYINVMGLHSKLASSHKIIIDSFGTEDQRSLKSGSIVYKLASNPNLSAVNAVEFYEATLNHDVPAINTVAEDLVKNPASRTSRVFRNAVLRNDALNTKPFNSKPPVELVARMRQVKPVPSKTRPGLAPDWDSFKSVNTEAEFNSYKENYDNLTARLKASRKRNAPGVNEFGESTMDLRAKKLYAEYYIKGQSILKAAKDEVNNLIVNDRI